MKQEENKNLREKAYVMLKNMLFNKRVVPGQKLIYRELSAMFNMSITPIQMALARLEEEGFVCLVNNVGYSVKEIAPKEVKDLFEIRKLFEIHSVNAAINNQTAESIKILGDKINKYREYSIDFYDYKKGLLDADIHLEIARLADNLEIVKQIQRFYEHIYLRSRIELFSPTRMRLSSAQHDELVGLMKSRDVCAAQALVCRHLQEEETVVLKALSREEQTIPFGP